MKIFIHIFAIYFAVMAFLPAYSGCMHDQNCIDEDSFIQDDCEGGHHDRCIPFCGHSCCHAVIMIAEVATFNIETIWGSNQNIFAFSQIELTNFSNSIWHPPKG